MLLTLLGLPYFRCTMRRDWRLVLIICVITPLSQTEPMIFLRKKANYQELKPEKEEKPKETAAAGPSEHPKTPLVHEEAGSSKSPTEKLAKGKTKAEKTPLPEVSPAVKVPYEKLDPQKITDVDRNIPIIWGVFHPEEGTIELTQEECYAHCIFHFGEIITGARHSIPTFVPHLINKGTVCRCEMNKEQINAHFIVGDYNYTEFTEEAKKGFCAARFWLNLKKIRVRILYEIGARELQPPDPPKPKGDIGTSNSTGTTGSLAGTSESGTSKVPLASPGEPLDKTPKETAEDLKAKKDKGKVEESQEEEVIVGAFLTGGPFTEEICQYHCLTTFGQIEMKRTKGSEHMGFTKASVSTDETICKCLLNNARSFKKHYTRLGDEYYEKLKKWCKNYFFCAAKQFSQAKATSIFLQYETLALPASDRGKRPGMNTPARSPIMTPKIMSPVRTPIMTPVIRTPERTPVGSPQHAFPAETINVMIVIGDASKKFLKTKIMGSLVHGKRTKEDCQKKCDEMFGFFTFSGDVDSDRFSFTMGWIDEKGRCKCLLQNLPIAVALERRRLRTEIEPFYKKCRDESYEAAIRFLLQKSPDFHVWIGDALSTRRKDTLAREYPQRCKFAADP